MRTHRKYAALLALVALALVAEGCAPYRLAKTPITKGYVALDDYAIAQEAAISIGSDPLTPRVVVDGIKRADAIGNPVAHTLAETLKEYRAARDEVLALENSDTPPSLEKVQKAQIALARLKNLIEKIRPFVSGLETAARGK